MLPQSFPRYEWTFEASSLVRLVDLELGPEICLLSTPSKSEVNILIQDFILLTVIFAIVLQGQEDKDYLG
jgi:hypothetical protein